jgi:hypothetical protein
MVGSGEEAGAFDGCNREILELKREGVGVSAWNGESSEHQRCNPGEVAEITG